MITIIASSVLLQFIAALLALQMIPVTGKKTAWLLIAAAIALMTVRRAESLVFLVWGRSPVSPDMLFETVGLAISCCMAAGIYLIRPLFSELARSEEEMRGMNVKLSQLSGEQKKLIAELQEAAANIKTLKGMLPICSSCKKVRDDKGYWSQIEVYVRDHSDAEFTHGLCPGCLDRYYSQYPFLKLKE